MRGFRTCTWISASGCCGRFRRRRRRNLRSITPPCSSSALDCLLFPATLCPSRLRNKIAGCVTKSARTLFFSPGGPLLYFFLLYFLLRFADWRLLAHLTSRGEAED